MCWGRQGEGQKIADTFPGNGELMNSELGIFRKETESFPQDASYKSRSAWKFPEALLRMAKMLPH